jgi:ubiquinone/menaquinone biosynthesis C-methylase UbiE
MVSSGKRKSSPSKKQRQPATVLEFWEGEAKKHGASDLATNPDQHYRKLEISRIIEVLKMLKHDTILDVGCGNGHTTNLLSETFPDADITGVDFSQQMVSQAENDYGGQIDFHVGDVLSLSRSRELTGMHFDVVLSTRCLINLANFDEQKIGILEMRKMLAPEGRLVLVENIKEGLDNLNAVRAKFGLDPIKERWHNHYLPQQDLMQFLQGLQGHMFSQEYVENIGNMYYMASRVIYAKMCKDQGIEPDYNNPINEIASQMPTFGEFYACSPNFLVVLKNEAGNANKAGKSLS